MTGHMAGASQRRVKSGPLANVVAVLMAGGAGIRFWPLSTPHHPKQFLTALTPRPLYVQAAERARLLASWDRILVMTHADFARLVRRQTPEVPAANVVLEPVRRNTAAAIILAATIVDHRWPGATMIVMPSDHLITELAAFRRTFVAAVARARSGGLGTIGIRPTFPATAFGYLHLGARPAGLRAVPVKRFVEKPDRARAARYVASGDFLWNSGIFVWRADVLLDAAERHLPQIYRPLASLRKVIGTRAFAPSARRAFRHIEAVSIDYGVMEKAKDVWAIPAAFSWSDVGSWTSVAELLPADAAKNHVRGNVILGQARRNVVVADGGLPVVVAGVSDCVIVQGPSGTLVCRKDLLDHIKPLLQRASSARA
jgi:mannose-1-phosphate guanylyltransferase